MIHESVGARRTISKSARFEGRASTHGHKFEVAQPGGEAAPTV